MSAGLATSTVTPGSTAPEASRTTPAMLLVCAAAIAGATTHDSARNVCNHNLRITQPLSEPSSQDPNDGFDLLLVNRSVSKRGSQLRGP